MSSNVTNQTSHDFLSPLFPGHIVELMKPKIINDEWNFDVNLDPVFAERVKQQYAKMISTEVGQRLIGKINMHLQTKSSDGIQRVIYIADLPNSHFRKINSQQLKMEFYIVGSSSNDGNGISLAGGGPISLIESAFFHEHVHLYQRLADKAPHLPGNCNKKLWSNGLEVAAIQGLPRKKNPEKKLDKICENTYRKQLGQHLAPRVFHHGFPIPSEHILPAVKEIVAMGRRTRIAAWMERYLYYVLEKSALDHCQLIRKILSHHCLRESSLEEYFQFAFHFDRHDLLGLFLEIYGAESLTQDRKLEIFRFFLIEPALLLEWAPHLIDAKLPTPLRLTCACSALRRDFSIAEKAAVLSAIFPPDHLIAWEGEDQNKLAEAAKGQDALLLEPKFQACSIAPLFPIPKKTTVCSCTIL